MNTVAGAARVSVSDRPAPIGGIAGFIHRRLRQVEPAERDERAVALEQQDHGRNIGLGGKIDRNRARLTLEQRQRQAFVGAAVPGPHVEQSLIGLDPDVEVLGQERGLRGRRLHGLATLQRDVLGLDRDAVVRVGLAPGLFRGPVVSVVDRVADAEVVLVRDRALEDIEHIKGWRDDRRRRPRSGQGLADARFCRFPRSRYRSAPGHLKARKPGVASPGMFQPPRLQGPCVPKSGPQAAIRRCKKEAPACGALCSMLSERGTCPMLRTACE